ncbi:hypothetical protein FACS189476_06500 [Spirochaetia bacterium]|nr:hypothetical protein FACS189476_06500 [Spirochaetia bacterium]
MVNNNLGSGSFGKTVLLQDPFIDELFVAKKYEPESDDDKERFYRNFLDEIKMLYKLNNRNVVRVYNYYVYENIFTGYIIMEFIDGEDIGKFMSKYLHFWDSPTLDDVFMQLIDGFQYIEEHGIIHRDIREGNILIDKSGTVKIIDFGIGKMVKYSTEKTDRQDSLVSEINRPNTLPQEYFDKTYTSQTDMFYLAELFNRLMRKAENVQSSDFSYHAILEKMMRKNSTERYASFAEVKEALDKYDFSTTEISQIDKNIYQNFANSVYGALSSFIDEKKFNNDVSVFIIKLENALKTNLFEDEIQHTPDVVNSIVTSRYKYSTHLSISRKVVSDFLDWFKRSTKQWQQIILNNIIAKLSTIKIVESVSDIPF